MTTLTIGERQEREALMSYTTVASAAVVGDVVRLLGATMDLRVPVQEGHQPMSITELQGLGREIWQEVNAREYINELRDEWDNR